MPAFPGATSSSVTSGLRASPHARACSRPPPPTTRTFTRRSPDGQALFAGGTHADHADRNADQLLHTTHVRLGLFGKVLERLAFVDLFLPALELFVDRAGVVEDRLMGRHVVETLAVGAIAGADLHGLEAAQHIQLRDQQLGEPVEARRVPAQARVEPSAAP